MIHILEVNSRDELAGYRLLWKSLLMQTRRPTFFQSLDWLEAYWRHRGRDEQLRIMIAQADGQPLGIVPLVVRNVPSWLGSLRVLTWPIHSAGSTLAPIGPNPAATLLAALRYLRGSRRDWDMVDLPGVDRFGVDQGRVQKALETVGLAPRVKTTDRAAVIELRNDWNDYWSSRDLLWREYVARNEAQLARRGNVEFVRYRPAGAGYGEGDPGWELFLECEPLLDVEQATPVTESEDNDVDWRRDAVASAARAGGLDLAALLVNGQAVACSWNVHCQGHVAQVQSGFSTSAARADAGSVLLSRMIADSFERGDRTFDLAPGATAVQRRWQTSVARSCRYTHVATTAWRARLVGA